MLPIHRIWSAIFLASHVFRSIWWGGTRPADIELLQFRGELQRAEVVLAESRAALEQCLSWNAFFTSTCKSLGLLGVELAIVLVFWCRCIKGRKPKTVIPSDSSDSDSDTVGSDSKFDKVEASGVGVGETKPAVRKGPTRPSDLKKTGIL
eukprot:s293_g26.t1